MTGEAMSKAKSVKKKKQSTPRIWISGIFGILLVGGLLFFALFHIRHIEVVGNTRYSDEAVKSMVLKGPLSVNSVYISLFHKHTDLQEIPFMNSVEVELISRNSIRLHVNEKQTIGYVEYAGMYLYFDTDGMVLESLSPQDADIADTDMLEPEEIQEEGAAQYHPALTNVPLIRGLKFEHAEVGSVLEVPDKEIFNTILGISKMVDKFEIIPDSVEFSDTKGIILHYDNARIYLGEDENLEEKITRLQAILPSIRNLTGILHLEDFSSDTVNIIFTKDNGTDPDDEKTGVQTTPEPEGGSQGDEDKKDEPSGDGTEPDDDKPGSDDDDPEPDGTGAPAAPDEGEA